MTQLNSAQILAFTQKHQLPDDFYKVINNHYLPLAHWLADTKLDGTEIIGISGV